MKEVLNRQTAMSSRMEEPVSTVSFSAPSGNEGNHLVQSSADGGSGQRLTLRGRSPSPALSVNGGGIKHSREDDKKDKSNDDKSWADVVGKKRKGRRPPASVVQGKGGALSAGQKVVAPFELYIGNTHPDSTAESKCRKMCPCVELK